MKRERIPDNGWWKVGSKAVSPYAAIDAPPAAEAPKSKPASIHTPDVSCHVEDQVGLQFVRVNPIQKSLR